MPEQLVRKVCGRCGSADVLCDAYAEWDLRAQQWVLQNTFDKGGVLQRVRRRDTHRRRGSRGSR